MNAVEILALVEEDDGGFDGGFDDNVVDPDYEADSDSEEEDNLALHSKPTKRLAHGKTPAPGPSKRLQVAPESDEEKDSETLLYFDPPEERPDAETDCDSGTKTNYLPFLFMVD